MLRILISSYVFSKLNVGTVKKDTTVFRGKTKNLFQFLCPTTFFLRYRD